VLGVEQAIGRRFRADEQQPGSTMVAILSDGFWKQRFGGDPAAIGAFATKRGVKLGAVAQALRVAVTGGAASPPLGLTLAILGRESALARIERCLAEVGGAA
jgi:glutamyl-tRNA synthetase